MKFIEKFYTEYKDKIESLRKSNPHEVHALEEGYRVQCKGLLDNYTGKIIEETLNLYQSGENFSAETIKNNLIERCQAERNFGNNSLESSYKDILEKFVKAKGVIYKLVDLKKQYSKMDFWEKCRALLLRVFTAIFIAAIVIYASYLAKCWEIPLPLRMGLTG